MCGSHLEVHWKTMVETIGGGVMIVDRHGIIISTAAQSDDLILIVGEKGTGKEPAAEAPYKCGRPEVF